MKIGVLDLDTRTPEASAAHAADAERAGYDSFWIPGGWRDPVTLATVAGLRVPRIEVAVSIVSVWGVKPVPLAEQALTVNAALDGRFVLGVGLSHFHMVEGRLGMKFERPIRYLREYLTILMTALEKGRVEFDGEILSAHTELKVGGMARPRVLVAALGPQAVDVAARWSDGFVTFMVPPRWLATQTLPAAAKAATEAGRKKPYLCAQAPVCLTNDPERARADCARMFANYGNGHYPSYRAALDRDGVKGPEDLAIIGDEKAFERGVSVYRDLGADEFMGIPFGTPEEQARTFAFLATLQR